jgi:hypothetical protein
MVENPLKTGVFTGLSGLSSRLVDYLSGFEGVRGLMLFIELHPLL